MSHKDRVYRHLMELLQWVWMVWEEVSCLSVGSGTNGSWLKEWEVLLALGSLVTHVFGTLASLAAPPNLQPS